MTNNNDNKPLDREEVIMAHDIIRALVNDEIPEAGLTEQEKIFLMGQLNALCFVLGHKDSSAQAFADNIKMMKNLLDEWGYVKRPIN